MVGMVGIEPTLPFGNGFLRPARLPIPPRPHGLFNQPKPGDYKYQPEPGQARQLGNISSQFKPGALARAAHSVYLGPAFPHLTHKTQHDHQAKE